MARTARDRPDGARRIPSPDRAAEESARRFSRKVLSKTAEFVAELGLSDEERRKLEDDRRAALEAAYRSDAYRVWPYSSLPEALAAYSDQSDWDLAILVPKRFQDYRLPSSWISCAMRVVPTEWTFLPDGGWLIFAYDQPRDASSWQASMVHGASDYPGPVAALERYRFVVELSGNGYVKGAKNPYTSRNGHMVSFLDANGAMALHLSGELEAEFRSRYESGPVIQYGATMRGYSLVPPELLADTDALRAWYDRAWDWVGTLKPKQTRRSR